MEDGQKKGYRKDEEGIENMKAVAASGDSRRFAYVRMRARAFADEKYVNDGRAAAIYEGLRFAHCRRVHRRRVQCAVDVR